MRSIFLQKGDSGVRSNQIKPHIRMLNDEVIQYCVGEIGVQLLQHENYLDKINNLPIPLERPKYEKDLIHMILATYFNKLINSSIVGATPLLKSPGPWFGTRKQSRYKRF